MKDFFFNLLIFPIEKVIELLYLFISRVSNDPVVSLFGLSAAVNIITLPLYFRAEKWQKLERDIQKRLSAKVAKIKKSFSGDEQYMILSVYYRQNHYHPIYALRNSFSLLIQVPFFIAAYSFITGYNILNNIPFLFIADLSQPDRLLPGGINLLPFIMTVISFISAAVYSKDFSFKEKIQLYGMGLLFLILLYNSPSGLVIYWTTNNIFSLIKSILQKYKNSKRIIYYCIYIFVLLLDIFLLFIHTGYILKRIIVAFAASTLFFLPLIIRILLKLKNRFNNIISNELPHINNSFFIVSTVILFLICGFVIPSSIISSSVPEFSFIDNYSSPFPFLFETLIQAAGIFLFWPFCLYFFFPKKIKIFFTISYIILCFMTLINVFIFPGSYGFLTNALFLSNPGSWMIDLPLKLLNLFILFLIIPFSVFFLTTKNKRKALFSVETIFLTALLFFGSTNVHKINRDFRDFSKTHKNANSQLDPVYNLSPTGKNVVIVMLDRAVSQFSREIFKEKPELLDSWDGFTWYPNCVSFGAYTLVGVPSLFGGYSYTPPNMQENPKTLVEKINEALLLLPRIFSGIDYKAVVTNPTYANLGWIPDLSIFEPYPEIHAENVNSAYIDRWMEDHPDVELLSISTLLKERLIRFSFFRTAPSITRPFIYDKANWLTVGLRGKFQAEFDINFEALGHYAALDYLPELTTIDHKTTNNFSMLFNELTHQFLYFQSPDYKLVNNVTNRGSGKFSDQPVYHVNMAAYLLLAKWFDYLKENNVYDNTRIIVVSDHGFSIETGQDSFILPDGLLLERYNPLMLIKDFNSSGNLKIDNTFMTEADLPFLALKNIIDKPTNPFTGLVLESEKENGVYVTTNPDPFYTKHGKYKYNIKKDQWLFVHDNIFDPNNWEKVER